MEQTPQSFSVPLPCETASQDRRRTPRHTFVRPCKMQRLGEVRYEPGETTNISSGGALLRVPTRHPIRAGERIRVGVAWESAGVIQSGSLLPARVVRVIPIDFHHVAVAVEYDRPVGNTKLQTGAAPLPVAA